MINGTINQISIPVTDFIKAKEFFEAVFNWNVDIEKYPNYAIVKWNNSMSLVLISSPSTHTRGLPRPWPDSPEEPA